MSEAAAQVQQKTMIPALGDLRRRGHRAWDVELAAAGLIMATKKKPEEKPEPLAPPPPAEPELRACQTCGTRIPVGSVCPVDGRTEGK